MRNLIDILLFDFPALLLYLLIRLILVKRIKINLKKDILRIIFVIYISSLIFIFEVKHTFYTDNIYYNFIPFNTIINYLNSAQASTAVENIIRNIIITVPLGFFTFLKIRIFPKMNIFLYSLLIPFFVEASQFSLHLLRLGTRSIDIDDILLNATGILLGYFIARLNFISKKRQKVII